MALVVICHFSNRCPLQLGDVDECLKNSHISYVATVTDDSIVALVSYANVRAFIESFNDKSKIGRHITAFSLPFYDINDIPRQYELIKYCLRSQKSEGTLDTKNDALGFLVSRISSVIDAKSLLHPALDKLARYDEENQTDLLNTLDVYLKYDRNAQRCANALYLHRNSLQYRVRRIQEIADINLDDAKERTYLRLSFLIS